MEEEPDRRFLDAAIGLQIITLVDVACRHPEWFTLNRTFAEVVAFLNGFYIALEWRKAAPEEVAEWQDFCLWIAGKLGVEHPEHLLLSRPRTHVFERIWLD